MRTSTRLRAETAEVMSLLRLPEEAVTSPELCAVGIPVTPMNCSEWTDPNPLAHGHWQRTARLMPRVARPRDRARHHGSMRFAFICDAGAREGSGHVARCLSVAEILRRDGHNVAWFADVADISWVGDEIADASDLIFLPAEDPAELEQQVLDWGPAAAVIDSYLLPSSFGARLVESGTAVVSVSDPATPDRPAHLIWSPGFATDEPSSNPPQVSGPRSVLLRSEFRAIRDRVASQPPHPAGGPWQVGVLLGGTPGSDLTRSVVAALDEVPLPIQIHVNADTSPRDTRQALVQHPLGPSYWEVLQGCDLVVSAAGVSALELMYVGIPAGLILTADNQARNYWGMTARGWVLGLGTAQQARDEPRFLATGVTEALLSTRLTQDRAVSVRDVVDGLGATRLADHLISLASPR